jgi:hypothetical protein
MGNYAAYLKDRFAIQKPISVPLHLPVIPLGVDCASFDPSEATRSSQRQRWRDKLKIAEKDIAVLFVGRLSFHEKAHPAPMYIALERAAKESSQPIHLILVGWFENDAIKKEFLAGAQSLCPSVKFSVVDGRNQVTRESIWFAADIFMSLSDNVQETFGLTPIEAMAAGLPVIVSDWDGYKETVQDGIDGFRIPTWMPPAGFASEMALSHAMGIGSYGQYVGFQSQVTAVDIPACTEALKRLVSDSELRQRMGRAAKMHALSAYDWSVVIRQYELLWKDLRDIRQKAAEFAPRHPSAPANPLRQELAAIFANYPTNRIRPDTLVTLDQTCTMQSYEQITALKMNTFAKGILQPDSDAKKLLQLLRDQDSLTVGRLCEMTTRANGSQLLSSLGWLAKMGMIQLHTPKGAPTITLAASLDDRTYGAEGPDSQATSEAPDKNNVRQLEASINER